MVAAIDMTGQIRGRLTVVSRAESDRGGKARWECLCVCGQRTTVRGTHLRLGMILSCGCWEAESRIFHHLKHGHKRKHGRSSRTYATWSCMLRRCRDLKIGSYPNYGGRGITVCDHWLKFENFLADMGERPLGTTIDRINNDGNYEPGNCRWATRKEQQANRRRPQR